jgi:TrmH family RNA methyltransferase
MDLACAHERRSVGYFARLSEEDHAAACEDIRQMSGPAQVKRVRALHQRKVRDAEGLFLVQGRKLVAELLVSDFEVLEVHATEDAARAMAMPQAIIAPAHDLERMGTFQHGNEVVAVVRTPKSPAPELPKAGELVLALDGISDPGNLGTLLRIADWFGISQLWCSAECVEAYNPKCVQASMGSLFRVKAHYMDLATQLHKASEAGVHLYMAEASGRDVYRTTLTRPAVLVLGSESHGLSAAVKAAPGSSIAVPRLGKAESLNVAAAASALCMEFVRQGVK